ncbi:MAG: ATP-binding protein [Pseudonocardiaceae bacterium]|nr:ATP-binding protein [Pseudonocardiaceae bacterium]
MTFDVERPADVFDREQEWWALSRFATSDSPGATLGFVSGRRRQGKTVLLQALCEATGGFYYEALQAEPAESLRHLGAALARYQQRPGRLALDDWDEALEVLLGLSDDEPAPVVIDEFPYLVESAPDLPSRLQAMLGPRTRSRVASRARLVLCGSALAMMGRLLTADAPLRGRSSLLLTVDSFNFRTAAAFWGIEDPELAFRVYSVLGGTPAYAREFVDHDLPTSSVEFDDWVARAVLAPTSPLLHEGDSLLVAEPSIEARNPAVYHSVLGSLVAGRTRHGEIAAYLGHRNSDLGPVLSVLEEAGFVTRDDDVVRRRRPAYRIADPYLRFHYAVARPRRDRLRRPDGARQVWRDQQETYRAQVLGPTFEEMARTWVRHFAAPERLGGEVSEVGRTVVNDRSARRSYEVDVVAIGPAADNGRRELRVLGEAKVGQRLGHSALGKLGRVRELLTEQFDTTRTRLAVLRRGLRGRAAAARRPDRSRPALHRRTMTAAHAGGDRTRSLPSMHG